jgi:hypothetical protein
MLSVNMLSFKIMRVNMLSDVMLASVKKLALSAPFQNVLSSQNGLATNAIMCIKFFV